MNPNLMGFSGSTNEVQLGNQSLPILQNQRFGTVPRFENLFYDRSRKFDYLQSDPNPIPAKTPSSSTETHEEHSLEDCDFSDAVLSYISQILMEEDMEDKTCMLQDSLDIQAAEKSFYEVLGEKYPPSPKTPSLVNDGVGSYDFSGDYGNCPDTNGDLWSIFTNKFLPPNSGNFPAHSLHVHDNSISRSSYNPSNGVEGFVDTPYNIAQVADPTSESQSIWQFQKGVEEASKFLLSANGLFANLSQPEPKVENDELLYKAEKEEGECVVGGSKGRKHPQMDEGDIEENRSSKQAAIYSEPTLRSDMADIILLHSTGNGKVHYVARREALQNKTQKAVLPKGQSKASGSGKGRGKKQGEKKEVVDLRTLLVLCAQAVAADDHRNAHELLKQIRQHSTPFGDGNQRLAHIFADGLEARLAGTGSQIYKGLVSQRTSAANVLKAYHLYLAACPFRKISNFISNITIRESSAQSMKVHVIDFGILYGFQWPTFIQRLSWRTGGPPKLRITGIDFPQPGFRPAERVIETGHRLAAYAEAFNVPFEYNAIAKNWDKIQLEELEIDKDEFLVVTCFYRGKNLLDESVVVDSPRNNFLSLIRKINPKLFIHGLMNGAFNAPFFVTRFREALFHYSSLFDMLETIVPREDWERMLIEKEIFGREALNVIACEGYERVERQESYKQWQARILRAGFLQQSFDRETVKMAMDKVRDSYHKDFVIDEDSQWLLQERSVAFDKTYYPFIDVAHFVLLSVDQG
ncbi:Scarecrow-like protein 9, partial [Mucuna pruriens]